jgi:hypothetical protein
VIIAKTGLGIECRGGLEGRYEPVIIAMNRIRCRAKGGRELGGLEG